MEMIPSLEVLPEEIIDFIAAELSYEEVRPSIQALSNLSRASRKFRRIAQPHLYRTIHILIVRNSAYDPCVQIQQLLRTLHEVPALQKHITKIRSMEYWSTSDYGSVSETSDILASHRPEHFNSCLHDLLILAPQAKLIDLRNYSIRTGEDLQTWMPLVRSHACRQCPPVAGKKMFQNLRRLEISIIEATISEIATFFSIPSLEAASFTIASLDPYSSYRDWESTKSRIRHLQFKAIGFPTRLWMHEIRHGFQQVAGACISLESFDFSLHSSSDEYNGVYQDIIEAFTTQLRTGCVRHFGLWSRETPVRILTGPLSDSFCHIWQDASPSLTALKIDAVMMCRHLPDGSAFFELLGALPRSLTHLTLRHNPCNGRFSGSSFLKTTLLTFAARFGLVVPQLEYLVLEVTERYGAQGYDPLDLQAVKDAFLAKGVCIQIE
ncbi:hypothetical protein BU26DRAFT_580352 [Trematosphaeria pertusa]|uniref:F-box domain-containing protein n=1 Tax=Trematosphaeria pertusa TaxID=390896 RepID=A0A6A6I1D9_9PLEO|nr:uncharacterized protein BU26DRAFT_580352 [Trematosphaeria pertusa]KAF2244314.1 hypothetical protein BU26DRAFT_580352 [Trematosphaeria pertusa]